MGVADVLEFESRRSLQDFMAEDLAKLARVGLSLGTRAFITAKNTEEVT